MKEAYYDRGCNRWVVSTTETIDAIQKEPGNISVGQRASLTITPRELLNTFAVPGQAILVETEPGRTTPHLTLETSEDGRIYVCDAHGDVGLDDSDTPILGIIIRWMNCVEWPVEEEFQLHTAIPNVIGWTGEEWDMTAPSQV
jgi:hypothetical protein